MRSVAPFCRVTIALVLLLFPCPCLANGWVSGVNAFRRTPDFYVIFPAIIAIEWIVLARALPAIRPLGACWRVVVFNAASSLAGDILFRIGWAPSSAIVWLQAIPFFFLSVAIELPVLRLLLRKDLHAWPYFSSVIVTANLASYALLLAIERPVREAWLQRLFIADQKVIRQWTNTQMFATATGCLYATESTPGGPHRLRYFDFKNQRWHSLSNSPALNPNVWDVKGNLLAFQTYADPSSRHVVRVTTLPDCTSIREFQLPSTNNNFAGGGEVALSPDRKKLAVLVPTHEIKAPLWGSAYRVPGRSCLVVVYDLATGERSICPRKALHTICWMPDSDRLLFHSLHDDTVLALEILPKTWQKRRKLDDPQHDPFARPPRFSYHPATGRVTALPDTAGRLITAQADRLICWSNSLLTVLNLTNGTRINFNAAAISQFTPPTVSPDNRFALVSFRLNPFTSYMGYPAIVNLENLSERFYLGPLFYHRVWAAPDDEPITP
jgi:hypothetical protein